MVDGLVMVCSRTSKEIGAKGGTMMDIYVVIV